MLEPVGLQQRIVAAVQAIFTLHGSSLAPSKRQLVATMVVHTFSLMLYAAFRDPDLREAIVAETREMVIRYLEPHLS